MEVNYNVQEIFIERLKDLMAENKLNIKLLSEATKIPDSTISDWLNSKTTPNMFNIVRIALFFGVTTDYLLGLED